MDTHLEMRRENGALLELWQDPRCSSRVETSVSGNVLSCIKGVKDLPRFKREGGISLKTLQWKRASSLVEGRISWLSSVVAGKLGFLSSYDGDLRDPLVWP